MEPNNSNNLNPSPPESLPNAAVGNSLPAATIRPFSVLKAGVLGLTLVILAAVGAFLLVRTKEKSQNPEELAVSLSQKDPSNRPFIWCPVVREQCAVGQTIKTDTDGKTIYAVSFSSLGSASQVFASSAGAKTIESDSSFLITNEERGTELRYVTSGDFAFVDANDSFYEEHEPIGSFGGEGNILTLYAKNTVSNQSVRLGIGKGGDYLTNLAP